MPPPRRVVWFCVDVPLALAREEHDLNGGFLLKTSADYSVGNEEAALEHGLTTGQLDAMAPSYSEADAPIPAPQKDKPEPRAQEDRPAARVVEPDDNASFCEHCDSPCDPTVGVCAACLAAADDPAPLTREMFA